MSDANPNKALERIRIAGFTSLRDVTLEPGRLTVLIGPNGSGKSNVLRALQMIPLMRTGSLQRFVAESGGASALLHYGPKRTGRIEVELDFVQSGARNRYRAWLAFTAGDKLMYADEAVGYSPSLDAEMSETSLGGTHWESELESATPQDTTARTVNWLLANLTFFHFHDTSMTSALRTHARLEDDRYLRSNGSNLASFLFRLKRSEGESEHKAWRRINRVVQQIAPCVKTLSPTAMDGGSVRLDWIDDQDERFGSHQLSDGTLRAIALVTALSQPVDQLPLFMSIDEPELGLHPAAIRLIADLARSVSRHSQVLFATQSTAFLDHFDLEDVVVVERTDGATRLERKDEEKYQAWLADYSLSEVFDKGVIGGRP